MPAVEFNKVYVTMNKLSIFMSENLTPCFLRLHATMLKSGMEKVLKVLNRSNDALKQHH